jgi:hypothetical protein
MRLSVSQQDVARFELTYLSQFERDPVLQILK